MVFLWFSHCFPFTSHGPAVSSGASATGSAGSGSGGGASAKVPLRMARRWAGPQGSRLRYALVSYIYIYIYTLYNYIYIYMDIWIIYHISIICFFKKYIIYIIYTVYGFLWWAGWRFAGLQCQGPKRPGNDGPQSGWCRSEKGTGAHQKAQNLTFG